MKPPVAELRNGLMHEKQSFSSHQPVEDLNDRLIEEIKNTDDNKNVIDPKIIQQQKELDILNY